MPNGILGFVLKRTAGKRSVPPALAAQAAAATEAAPAPATSGKVLLDVPNLSKAIKGVQALDGVSLQGDEGEIIGLPGPKGSGKANFQHMVGGAFPGSLQ